MNRIAIFLTFLCCTDAARCQNASTIQEELNKATSVVQEEIKEGQITQELARLAESIFKWKVQENSNAYMMTLDIPYPDFRRPKDYLSITVVKFKGAERPRVISFALSSMIDSTKGISVYFGKINSGKELIMSADRFEQVAFTETNSEFVKLTANEMYLDKDKKRDLLKPMLEMNQMIFQFTGLDGKPQRVACPLGFFQEEFAKLK